MAAAAAVTLMTSEQQSAHAAPAADGNNVIIGAGNSGTSGTSLGITAMSPATYVFAVDATGSANAGVKTIEGQSAGTSAVGIYGSNSSSGYGV